MKGTNLDVRRLQREVANLGGTIIGTCDVCKTKEEVVHPLTVFHRQRTQTLRDLWICGSCLEDIRGVLRRLDECREEAKP